MAKQVAGKALAPSLVGLIRVGGQGWLFTILTRLTPYPPT
jgi:hypothetical protein